MIGCKKIFLDTAPFIYFIEKNEDNPQYFDKIKRFLIECYNIGTVMQTSVITVEEYMVFPYRNNEQGYVKMFDRLLHTLEIDVLEIDRAIAEKAARIRAEYRTFKSMDAIQLASACIAGCDLFLTNDKQLRQFGEIRCVTVDELE